LNFNPAAVTCFHASRLIWGNVVPIDTAKVRHHINNQHKVQFMKIHKTSLMAILAAGGLLALGPALSAQDEKKDKPADSKPAETRPPGDRPGPGGPGGGRGLSVDDRLARLSEQLSLTDEQKPKVKALLEEQGKVFAEARDLSPEERRTKMQASRDEMTKKMKAILTEEQFKKFEALPRGRGQGGGPGGPPPGAGGNGGPPPEKKPDAPKQP
jgi:Spy/CpxP family protein refolding chaperone